MEAGVSWWPPSRPPTQESPSRVPSTVKASVGTFSCPLDGRGVPRGPPCWAAPAFGDQGRGSLFPLGLHFSTLAEGTWRPCLDGPSPSPSPRENAPTRDARTPGDFWATAPTVSCHCSFHFFRASPVFSLLEYLFLLCGCIGVWCLESTRHGTLSANRAPAFSCARLSGSGPGSPLPEASRHIHTQRHPSARGSPRCSLCTL